jgi:type IV secretion system protein VirB6
MALVGDSLRAMLIIGLATSVAAGGSQVYWTLTDGLAGADHHSRSRRRTHYDPS